jgi:hypothetical protein
MYEAHCPGDVDEAQRGEVDGDRGGRRVGAQRPVEQRGEQSAQRLAVALVDLARQPDSLRTGRGDPQQRTS